MGDVPGTVILCPDLAMSWELSLSEGASLRRREGDRLRRHPALLSALLDGSDIPVMAQDARGRIVLFSRACEALSGYRADETRGRWPWDFLIPADAAETWKAAFNPLHPERVPPRQELPWRTRDGQVRRLAWWHTVLPDVEGVPRYVVSTGMDLTDLRALETRAAEIAERERERFGQDLHDGLGQELTGVALSSGLLRAKLASRSPELSRQAAEIEALARKAIAKARALARGVYPVGLVTGGLPEHLRELARFAEETFQVDVELDWDPRVEIGGEGAARNLYWIVQEAVTNAVRHGGCRRIRIQASREAGGARIRVRDDGRGIGPDLKEDGLGLRVMRSRARAVGADLRIEDHPEGGVLVDCAIPMRREERT